MQPKPPKTIVMVAGEASGDLHGARVIRSLRKRHDDIYVCGAGGSAMRAEGARLTVDANELSVMGFTAIFSKAPQILNAIAKLKKLMVSLKPDLVVLIDFPDFNIHLAASAKKSGYPGALLHQSHCLGLATEARFKNQAAGGPHGSHSSV
jgi:lipid-A-disaccharide synthase